MGKKASSKKVTPEIAKIRRIDIGTDSISSKRHKNINSTADLIKLIKK